MGKTGSYIKLDRGLKSNFLWIEKPFSKGQAWVDLLLLAQGVEKEKQYRGRIQKQKSGEIYTSIIFLTKRWGWSRNKVYRFLEMLIEQKMIAIKGWKKTEHSDGTNDGTQIETNNGTTNGTIISIENWALYQTSETKDDTNNGTQDGTQNRTRNGTHNIKQYTENANKRTQTNIKGSLRSRLPQTVKEIDFDRDLGGLPDLDQMPQEADGTKRDIPERVRKLFDGDYRAYRRFVEDAVHSEDR